MMTKADQLFDKIVNVPKCCIELPWENKCLPCKKCRAAWGVYHSVPCGLEEEEVEDFLLQELQEMCRRLDAKESESFRTSFDDPIPF